MPFLKAQVSFPSNFASIFSAIKQLLSTFLPQTFYTLVKRNPLKSKFVLIFECSGQHLSNSSCRFWNNKSILFQIFHYSSLSRHIAPLQILSSYIFYLGQKDPIKAPVLILSSALVKIFKIPHVIFQTTSQFFFEFCITLQCHEKLTPLYFFRWNIIYFAQK